jgi:hypothetical protein
MKKLSLFCLATAFLFVTSSFVEPTPSEHRCTHNTNDGQSYWFVSYTINMNMYVSYVFNNDCNHCENEIREAYKEYLGKYSYTNNPMTSYMNTYHDISEANLEERRDELITQRKNQGYYVLGISFSYK